MATPKTALVTGSSGLVGSQAVAFLDARGWRISDLRRLRTAHPQWDVSISLDEIFAEVAGVALVPGAT